MFFLASVLGVSAATIPGSNHAPVSHAGGPYAILVEESVTLDASASYDPDAGEAISQYKWDLNGDGADDYVSADPVLILPWSVLSKLPRPGVSNPVRLTVTDSHEAFSESSTTLTISENIPVALFSISPNPVERNQSVRFNASGSYHGYPVHAIVHYDWDFDNDGTFDATGLRPAHRFSEFGDYKVRLRVTDDNVPPKTATVSKVVAVSLGNHPPLADAKGPYTVETGEGVTLDAGASFDPDAGDGILQYEWDLDNDGGYEYSTTQAFLAVPWSLLSARPRPAVINVVALRVTDLFGAQAVDSTTLTIFNNQPVAVASVRPDNPITPGELVRFDASFSHQDSPRRHLVQYEWDFNSDGTFDATGVLMTNRFMAFGAYTVVLRVIDDNVPAKTSTVSTVVQVAGGNRPPQADAGGPYFGSFGSSVTLDATGSFDPDQGDAIASYRWDLDSDGTDDLTSSLPTVVVPWSQWLSLPHFGQTNGVSLRVTDSFGAVSTDRTVFAVYTNAPVASFSVRPDNPVVTNQPVRFDASASRHGHPAHAVVSYEWDFDGDGLFEGAGLRATNRYPHAGVFTVQLRVTDDNVPPLTATATRTVTISESSGNHPPWPDAGRPYVIAAGDGAVLNASASSDPDAGDMIICYEWDMNGDGAYDYSSTQPTLVVPWSQVSVLPRPGVTNMLTLRVTDLFSARSTDSTTLMIVDSDPVAAFSVRPVNPIELGQPVRFDATASHHGSPAHRMVRYDWDFDNNGVFDATGVDATNRFSAFGAYTVVLRVTDDSVPAKTSTVSTVVQVTGGNRPPQAHAGGLYVVNSGSNLVLDATGSFDPDMGDAIVMYRWDLDGDGTNDLLCFQPTAVVSWNQLSALPYPGVFNMVRLSVVDTFGAWSTDSTAVVIYDDNLVAAASATPAGFVAPGQPVRFDAALSHLTRPGHSIVSYAWDFDNDGVFETNGVRLICQFSQFGEHPVRLRVTDDSTPPRTADASLLVMANQGNHPPVANAGGPYKVEFGNGMLLDSSATADPDAGFGDFPAEYTWNVANGMFYLYGANPAMTPEQVLLLDRGAVPLTLTVMDGFGSVDEADSIITIPPIRFDGAAQTITRTGSGVRLHLVGLSGRAPLSILTSTNLVDWAPLFSGSSIAGQFEYVDSMDTNRPVRFYRAVESNP
jgi:hypothetical protein